WVTVPFFQRKEESLSKLFSGCPTDLLDQRVFLGPSGDINDLGQAVGYSASDSNDVKTSHALLWQNGVMIVLQDKIPVGSGWTLLVAGGINKQGQINGFGLHNGNFRGFPLTPVP